jgi:peptidyl-prolyl cis-trans isomerase C
MTVAAVNGVPLAPRDGEPIELAAARELMRQRAVALGLIVATAGDEGEIDAAIEALLEREVTVPEPTEEECRRYYDRHRLEFDSGELVHARHILFQVTPGVNVTNLRARAEQALNELLREPGRFAAMAQELSNCPSGQQGGNLGQIGRGDMVPEFEKALFRIGPTGILSELVKTRHGLHIVAVDQRLPGNRLPFEMVHDRIAERLQGAVEEKALRQYVSVLAGQADLAGVELGAASTPLVQ